MNRLNFSLLLAVFSIVSISQYCVGQSRMNLATPVYIGGLLLEQPDSVQMAEVCRVYGFMPVESEDGFAVYADSDNTKVRFKMVEKGNQKVPLVEMAVKEKDRIVKKVLSLQGFTFSDGIYIKGSKHSNIYSVCTYKGGRIARLTFTKNVNN